MEEAAHIMSWVAFIGSNILAVFGIYGLFHALIKSDGAIGMISAVATLFSLAFVLASYY